MTRRNQIIKYLTSDILSALVSWTLIYALFRYMWPDDILSLIFTDEYDKFYIQGLFIYPGLWVAIYFISGFYRDLFRRSRLKEFGASLMVTFAGIVIVFLFMIPPEIESGIPRSYFSLFLVLFLMHFFPSYIPRLIITSLTTSAIQSGKLGFTTLIIGSDKKAVEIYREINEQIRSTGNKFIGFININGSQKYPLKRYLPHLGGLEQLSGIITKNNVREVIIAIEATENGKLENILKSLDHPGLIIKAIPGMSDILTGRVRIDTILETPLIRISHNLMPAWQANLKQAFDIILSVIVLIAFMPVSLIIMIWVRLSTRGPVIYSHERIGRNGKPFRIYKFRTMINNAEKNGPELSSGNDTRVTRPGKFLRRTRLDEIPNFINVLKGEMSIVGPRPERKHYIDQIVKKAPHYHYLLKIKPGITSWGQVRYGYAENVDQMIQRLKYDMIYLENMSVFVDFQILIHTILIIFKRKGV